jgi:hypothetical protein
LVPSGDHAGPPPPRESMPIVGVGAYHLSRFGAPASAAMVRIWFVPSRKRLVNGATSASATCLPSGDQVGAPGCGSES